MWEGVEFTGFVKTQPNPKVNIDRLTRDWLDSGWYWFSIKTVQSMYSYENLDLYQILKMKFEKLNLGTKDKCKFSTKFSEKNLRNSPWRILQNSPWRIHKILHGENINFSTKNLEVSPNGEIEWRIRENLTEQELCQKHNSI